MKATLDVKLKALNDLMDEYNPKEEDQDEDKTAIDDLEEKIMAKLEEKLKGVVQGTKEDPEDPEEPEKPEETKEKENEENGNN